MGCKGMEYRGAKPGKRGSGHLWNASVVAIALTVSACGGGDGGGVNSTPTPVPTPTPTPTPTSNDDLIAPLVSESFTNTAAAAAANYDPTGTVTSQTRSTPAVKVAYDAGSNSYTITAAGASQTFGPGNLLKAGEYRVASGNTTDDLTLTATGPSSGEVFRYVGAGFWQRQVQTSAGGIDGSITSFVYGVPTVSLVRTGTVGYATMLYGTVSNSGTLYAAKGPGALVGDLASGVFQNSGRATYYDPNTGASADAGSFLSRLTLSSTANSLTGTMSLIAFGRNYSGPVAGMFFGPSAEEVGASFSASDPNGNVATGAFIGRNDPSLGIVPLDKLTATTSFQVEYYGQNLGNALTYDPASGTYTIAASDLGRLSNTGPSFYDVFSQFNLGPAQKSATQNTPNFTTYDGTVDGRTLNAQFYNVGAANSEIQLSYLSFYRVEIAPASGSTGSDVRYALFGVPTPSALIPTSGTAHYTGPVYGTGEFTDGSKAYDVSGDSSFDVNFGTGAGSGTLDLKMASMTTGNITSLPVSVNLASGFLSTGASTNGYVTHTFFGNNAQELGISFGFFQDLVAVSGVAVATRN